jgi:hypothetical protein
LPQVLNLRTGGPPRRQLAICGIALLLVVALTVTMSLRAGIATGTAARPSRNAELINALVASQEMRWQQHVTSDGRIVDPLASADSGDDYGVILLADAMLRAAAQDGNDGLAQSGERIVLKAATIRVHSGPFELFAIGELLRDGERGYFPRVVWERIGATVLRLARRVTRDPRRDCSTTPGCYNNWRLVWAAGASALLASHAFVSAPSALGTPRQLEHEVAQNLRIAARNVGVPVRGSTGLGPARELSDPREQPQAYELFSAIMLQLVRENDPGVVSVAVQRHIEEVGRYALLMMAPDGQLSFSGRSLGQSWVQTAGVDLGMRNVALGDDPSRWRSFAERALAYLTSAYRPLRNGLIPTVPGLGYAWSRSIVDSYAAFAQYSGLALWFLSDALVHDHAAPAAAPLPADRHVFLIDDLATSGSVWGRRGRFWWEVRGRATGTDTRLEQGLVAVTVHSATGWVDLLALRPIGHGLGSTWRLTTRDGHQAAPEFTSVTGNGGDAVLAGYYREADGRRVAPVRWSVRASSSGLNFTMTLPFGAMLRTTLWLPRNTSAVTTSAARAFRSCSVTASGRACPLTLTWTGQRAALFIG